MNNWKQWIVRLSVVVAVIGAFALLLTTYSSVRQHIGTLENFGLPEPAGYDMTDDVEMLETAVFTQNGRTLYVSAGGAVRLADDQTQKTLWRNTAEDDQLRLLGTEDAAVSPVSIVYRYDGETDITLYSEADAVDNEQYTVAYSEDESRLRVTYLFGEVGQSGILPMGITKDTMEQQIFLALTAEEQEYLLRRYALYTEETAKTVVWETCPGVKTTPLYYLENCDAMAMKRKTAAYLEKAGMTEALYEQERALTGEQPVSYLESYLVTVEYWLDDGDVMVNIPCEEIRFHPENPLTTVTLNGAATYATTDEDGWYFLPSGSGALQYFSEETDKSNAYRYFGKNDLTQEKASSEYGFPFPVYGVRYADGTGLLAVIEQGAAQAILEEKCSDGASQLMLSFRLLTYGDSSVTAQNTSTVFADCVYEGDLTVRYRPLTQADVSSMATAYRDLLKVQGKLPTVAKTKDTLLLELVGNVSYSYQWGGMLPMTGQVTLTDWDETTAIRQTLTDSGLHATVKLSGYNEHGLFDQTPGSYIWASALGNKATREAALTTLTEQGAVYVDVNLAYCYNGNNRVFTGYHTSKNARLPNNQTATRVLQSRSTGDPLAKAGTLQVVSPYWYVDFARDYADALDPRLGIGIGDSARCLNVDFSEKHPINRTDALTALIASAEVLTAERSLMSQNPLVDTLPYLTVVENLDLTGGKVHAVSEEVPFVQMVLHGHVAYTGRPLNASSNYREALLQAVETGSMLKFTVAGHSDGRLRDTEYDYLYYVDFAQWREALLNDTAQIQTLYDRVQAQELVTRDKRGDLVRTQYADGTAVYVNYGNFPALWDSITVPALSWVMESD